MYAIWEPMLPGDRRSDWDSRLLDDRRVTHLWDANRLTGQFFAETFEHRPRWVQWDAYYVFAQGTTWEEAARGMRGSGRTILAHTGDLERQVAADVH